MNILCISVCVVCIPVEIKVNPREWKQRKCIHYAYVCALCIPRENESSMTSTGNAYGESIRIEYDEGMH